MKKRFPALLLTLALCCGLLAGCGASNSGETAPDDTSSDGVQEIPSLKIAFSPYADADIISESTQPLEVLLKEKLLENSRIQTQIYLPVDFVERESVRNLQQEAGNVMSK